ncbi:FkbM family methyltransferase [Tamlana sp. s12]|uniref:FkbM family methyltransferase n=1 Tax=Tamlana sp. s12 TaxID=1630406 RepID=UPI0007FE92C6|nr:FkbM family methyltransferase [Tamlana sp. s12]OBQ55397.1 hypothetical protein VQ01_07945 [Tamlana sp. s12]QQY80923.1 FkbM family methyltransferase [Tamlana sp. s12]
MKRLKKIRKIYRILFPIKFTEDQVFQNKLASNPVINSFIKNENNYEITLRDGEKLVLRNQNHSDYDVFKQVFNDGEYDIVLNILRLNPCFQKKKTILVDAGANVGYTTAFFSSNLNSLDIYGVEPSKANCDMYMKNSSFLKHAHNIKLYHKALSESINTNYKIERNFGDKRDWSLTTTLDEEGEIGGVTINEIIEENRLEYISLLKIDIEGAERFIFRENNDFSFLKKTEILAIEIHDEFGIRERIYDILRRNDFFIFDVSETTIGLNQKILQRK